MKNDEFEGITCKYKVDEVKEAISKFENGKRENIAIMTEPFIGRTSLSDLIQSTTKMEMERIHFSSLVLNPEDFEIDTKKQILIVENCHYLYSRQVGGFDILQKFLEYISSSDKLFICIWNVYSWKYLAEAVKIGNYFPVQKILGKLNAKDIEEIILSDYDEDEIEFIHDIKSTGKDADRPEYSIELKPFNRKISIPYVRFDINSIKQKLFRKKETRDAKSIVFDTINQISNGNPGVARMTWEKSLEYPVIRTSNIREIPVRIDLGFKESFILFLILSYEKIGVEYLLDIIEEPDLNNIIHKLKNQGLISFNGIECKDCSIRPESLKSVVDHLARTRLVWV